MKIYKKLISVLVSAAFALTASAAVLPVSAVGESSSVSVSASQLTARELADMTSTDYGYKDLALRSNGEKRQELYRAIYDLGVSFWDNDKDITKTISASDSNGNLKDYYYSGTVPVNGLSFNEVNETLTVVRHDCPLFYYFTTILVGSTKAFLTIEDVYAKASYRAEIKNKILGYIDRVAAKGEVLKTNYEKMRYVNDTLVGDMEYAFDENGEPESAHWAHNIIGAVDNNKGVCECFAKTAEMLGNFLGVDTILVIGFANGGSHAWNAVLMDDGNYYYLDVTWNENVKDDTYFLNGKTSFLKEHEPFTPKNTGVYFLYDMPDIPDDDYAPAEFAEFNENWGYYVENGKAYISEYKGSDSEVVIPEEINGFPVGGVGKRAFYDKKDLVKVTLPSGCTKLCDGAFACCYYLTTVVLPEGLAEIGNDAFFGDAKLRNVVLPENLRTIGAGAFLDCLHYGTVGITIPLGVESIGKYAFGYYPRAGTYSFDQNYNVYRLPSFTVTCYEGTEGCRYAEENGFTIVKLAHVHKYEPTTVVHPTYTERGYTVYRCSCGDEYIDDYTDKLVLPGDISGDGVLGQEDLDLIGEYLVGGPDIDLDRADVDKDGEVTMRDYGLIKAALAGKDVELK